jgi:hypothetical protein
MLNVDKSMLKRVACAALCALLLAGTPARADDDGDDGGGSTGGGAGHGGGGGSKAPGGSSGRGAPGSGNFLADIRSFGRALVGVTRSGEGGLATDIVASVVDAQASARLRAAGFGVIAQRPGTLVAGNLVRLSPPAGTDTGRALAQARALAPCGPRRPE